MNAPAKVETGTMTSKGQVLIPKAIRDAAGLVPGRAYKVMLDEGGRVTVAPIGDGPEDAELRVQRMREGLKAISGKFSTGRGTDAIMRELRGDWEP